jgi:hypothetical protein
VRNAQFFLAVRTLSIEGGRLDPRIRQVETKLALAQLASHFLGGVLAIDAEFSVAVGTQDVIAGGLNLCHAVNLLKRDKRGDLDAALVQFFIEQCAATLAVNQIRRHVLATLGTPSSGPRSHLASPNH